MKQKRDSHGRFKTDHRARNIALGTLGAGTALAAVVGGAFAALRFGLFDRFLPGNGEHAAPDLALNKPHPGPKDRAPAAFRPDPTAPVTAAERDGLRPAPALAENGAGAPVNETTH